MYNAVATQIIAILNTISGINIVYDGEKKELKKYPAACVSFIGHQNKFNDSAANRRVVSFMIRVYYRSEDETDAEQTVRNIADAIVSAIESNVTLNGSCELATPTTGKGFYAEREVPVRGIEITIDAVKRVIR